MTALILLAGSLWFLFYMIFQMTMARRQRLKKRIDRISRDSGVAMESLEETASLNERIIKPILDKLYAVIDRISPRTLRDQTELRLRVIGWNHPRAYQQWIAMRLVMGGVLPVSIGVLALRYTSDFQTAAALTVAPMMFVQVLMTLYLLRKTRSKKEAIERQLPDVLDIITVSVEAGLSFDGALEKVIQKTVNELSAELGITLKEMRMGKIRREALKALSERCDVPDLTTWVGAMIQADELGVGIGNVLRIQSVQMREKRRFRAREKSMKAPVKILIPLVLFIFPTIFIILLGPAAINIYEMFIKR